MPKIFPVTVKKVVGDIVIVPPEAGELDRERLIYERPEVAPVPADRNTTAMVAGESHPAPMEFVVAALLAQAAESAPLQTDTATAIVTQTTTEASPDATARETVATVVGEPAPIPVEQVSLVSAITGEPVPAPVLAERLALSIPVEPAPPATDALTVATVTAESAPTPVERAPVVAAVVGELPPAPVEDVNIDVTVTVNDGAPVPVPLESIATALAELAPNAGDSITMTLTYKPGATTVTQSGAARNDWTNIANAQGKPDLVFATITGAALAARSGRLNATIPAAPASVTGNFTITAAQLQFWLRAQLPALANAQGQVGYKFNGGADVLLATLGVAGATTDYFPSAHDITALIAGNWANVPLVQPYCLVQLAVTNTSTYSMDAFVVSVTATRTEP